MSRSSSPELTVIEAHAQMLTERAVLRQLTEAETRPCQSLGWTELAAGHVMLVDMCDRDGKCVLVAATCSPAEEVLRRLTAVEDRIARRAGRAMTNREIALQLRLSQTAVENHLSRALRKLGLRDRIALARLYTQLEAAGRV